jgi:hypothetical protein
MKRVVLLIILLLATSACRQSQQQAATETASGASVQIEMVTEPDPIQTGAGTLLITARGPDGTPADVVRIDVRGDMNHAGMQPVFGSAESAVEGVFRVPFNWSMAGDWILEVTAALRDGSTASQRFDVTVES